MPIDIAVNWLTYGLIKNLSECVAKLTALKSSLDPKLNPCFHHFSSYLREQSITTFLFIISASGP